MNPQWRLRLAFDAAGVLGLVLLGLSFWFEQPRAKWRVPLDSQNVWSLGFSADDRFVYTMKDCCIEGSKLPKGPIIECWNVRTGQLRKEYPLQIPEEDRALVRPMQKGVLGICFHGYVYPGSGCLMLVQQLGLGAEPSLRGHRCRLFDLSDGKCITKQPVENDNLWTLVPDKENARKLAIGYARSEHLATQVVYDVETGERVHVFDNSSKRGSRGALISWDKRFLVILWARGKENDKREFDLEVFRIDSWERVFRTTLKGYDDLYLFAARPDRLMFHRFDSRGDQLLVYRFDPERGILDSDEKHPSHGSTSDSGWFAHRDKYLLATVCKDPNLGWRHVLEEGLKRIGLHLTQLPHRQSYRVYDLDSGKLLRQLTGIDEFDTQMVALSHDGQNVIGIERDYPLQVNYLTLFHIPHYLWERSWTFLFYVALVLIVLWPFRFLRKRMAIEIRPVPPLEQTAQQELSPPIKASDSN